MVMTSKKESLKEIVMVEVTYCHWSRSREPTVFYASKRESMHTLLFKVLSDSYGTLARRPPSTVDRPLEYKFYGEGETSLT
jgi:hypothetical protein